MMRMFVLLLLLASAREARADDAPAPVTDPAAVRAHYRQVVTRPEFQEGDDMLADMHWGDWLSQWLTRVVSRFQDFRYAGQFSSVARVLVVAMAAFALAGLVYLVMRLSRRRCENARQEAEPPAPESRLLTPRQYESRLRRALADGDWHGAWLAAWLQLLARLENRQLVDADRSRTNREYLAQLRERALPADALPLLAHMVDDYDRVIYGVRPVDEAVWNSFRERIEQVTLMLGLRERVTEETA